MKNLGIILLALLPILSFSQTTEKPNLKLYVGIGTEFLFDIQFAEIDGYSWENESKASMFNVPIFLELKINAISIIPTYSFSGSKCEISWLKINSIECDVPLTITTERNTSIYGNGYNHGHDITIESLYPNAAIWLDDISRVGVYFMYDLMYDESDDYLFNNTKIKLGVGVFQSKRTFTIEHYNMYNEYGYRYMTETNYYYGWKDQRVPRSPIKSFEIIQKQFEVPVSLIIDMSIIELKFEYVFSKDSYYGFDINFKL